MGACLVGLFAWETVVTPEFVPDDSYITFVFSRNLARGLGPTYGLGMHIEGYSNFLWMALVAIPLAIRRNMDPVLAARVASLPFVLMLFAGTFALARRRAGAVPSLAAVGLLAVNVNLVLAYDSGLETLPYAALLSAGFAAQAWSDESSRARRLVIPLFVAAALTRIDGFLPLGFVIAVEAARAFVARRSLVALVRWALPGVLVWCAWFAWRYWYYGLPLPSTYYAKQLIPELLPRRGPEYVFDELAGSGLWIALGAFGFLLYRRQREAVPVGLYAIGQLAYAAKVGGDWMPSARFVLPATPLLVVLLAWAVDDLIRLAAERGRALHALVSTASVGLLVWIGARSEPHGTDPYVDGKKGFALSQQAHVAGLLEAASYLAVAVPKGGRLVTDYGGVIAYYTASNPIEMWGLCNATIATRGDSRGVQPIYGKTCPSCYPELRPEYFHVYQPIVRRVDSFARHADVVRSVWQTDTIGRYMDIMGGFVSGRVRNERNGRAVWFLEKKGDGWKPHPRRAGGRFVVEYPFVPGGLI